MSWNQKVDSLELSDINANHNQGIFMPKSRPQNLRYVWARRSISHNDSTWSLEQESPLSESTAEIRMWSCREFMASTPTITKVFLCPNLIHKLSETPVHGGVFHAMTRRDRTRISSKKLAFVLQKSSMWNDLDCPTCWNTTQVLLRSHFFEVVHKYQVFQDFV